MQNKIKIINGAFSYDDKKIFEELNLSFDIHKITFLTGRSGIGKTTLLKIIARKLKLQSGKIINPIKDFSFCYQDMRLLPYLTVSENICYIIPKKPKKEKREIAEYFLDKVELLSYKNYLPSQLSGGMQRRLQFARCLAFGKKFFLLDEIFTSLDDDTACKILDLLICETTQNKGGAICVTHKIPYECEFTETIKIA